jgi:hypothetical protein
LGLIGDEALVPPMFLDEKELAIGGVRELKFLQIVKHCILKTL